MSSPSMIGPSLPPHLAAAKSAQANDESQTVIGPQLPPTDEGIELECSSKVSYGPSLPPGMTYGPSIPEDTIENDDRGDDDDDDDDIIGPLPPTNDTSCDSLTSKRREIEARAQTMKNKLTKSDKDTKPQRESWMTELPSGETKIGLGPRKFRSTYAELGDQSVWTDTPAEKARKAVAAREREMDALQGIKTVAKKHEPAAEVIYGPMTREICGITSDTMTLRRKMSAYPPSESTLSCIHAPLKSFKPIAGAPISTALSII